MISVNIENMKKMYPHLFKDDQFSRDINERRDKETLVRLV